MYHDVYNAKMQYCSAAIQYRHDGCNYITIM